MDSGFVFGSQSQAVQPQPPAGHIQQHLHTPGGQGVPASQMRAPLPSPSAAQHHPTQHYIDLDRDIRPIPFQPGHSARAPSFPGAAPGAHIRTPPPPPPANSQSESYGVPPESRQAFDAAFGHGALPPGPDLASAGHEQAQELPTQFIDAIATEFHFGDAENDLRANLHLFARLGQGLSKPDLATRVYLLAVLLDILRERRMATDLQRALQAMITDLTIRLEDTFSLSTEQKANVRLIAGELLFDATRIDFMHLHVDVYQRLQADSRLLRFSNVFGNPARERILMMSTKRMCSNQRNSFREILRDSVIGESTVTLEEFVYEACQRLGRTDYSQLGSSTTARIAILRRFAYENPELLNRKEAEDVNDDGSANSTPLASPHQSPRTRATNLTSTTPEPSSTPADEARAAKKRKLPANAGRTKRGEDFWSAAEKWFAARRGDWGDKWSTDGWRNYIRDTINKDHEKFKHLVVPNPYMAGTVNDGRDAPTMEIDGGARPQTSTLLAAGGLTAMTNILNALQ